MNAYKIETTITDDGKIILPSDLKNIFNHKAEKYIVCSQSLKNLINSNSQIFVSTQILREFFAVVTNKKYMKNPLSVNEANKQIKFFQSNFNILPINENVINQLLNLTEKYNITGQKVHDTTITATMLEYGLTEILTYNKIDFKTFIVKIIIKKDRI